jgi:hypothetical protein
VYQFYKTSCGHLPAIPESHTVLPNPNDYIIFRTHANLDNCLAGGPADIFLAGMCQINLSPVTL